MLLKLRAVGIPLVVVSSVCLVLQAHAASYGITNNNSFALLDPGSASGMYNWSVLASPGNYQNQLNQQSFWYRVGSSGGEASLSSLTLASVNVQDASTLTTTYADSFGR